MITLREYALRLIGLLLLLLALAYAVPKVSSAISITMTAATTKPFRPSL